MTGKKLHPHLKAFIHSVVVSEMGGIGPSKNYVWKEKLMREVQTKVLDRINEVKTQQDLEKIISEEAKNVKEDFGRTLEMISNTLKMIPLEVVKQSR